MAVVAMRTPERQHHAIHFAKRSVVCPDRCFDFPPRTRAAVFQRAQQFRYSHFTHRISRLLIGCRGVSRKRRTGFYPQGHERTCHASSEYKKFPPGGAGDRGGKPPSGINFALRTMSVTQPENARARVMFRVRINFGLSANAVAAYRTESRFLCGPFRSRGTFDDLAGPHRPSLRNTAGPWGTGIVAN